MIGQTLGHYRVLEHIGAGGMGVVYRAHDERLDRDVALKVLPAGTLADESARKRFRKEALTLSKLNHPNIETVFDFDTQDGVDFLVMELIPGVTLDQKLVAGPLPEKEVLRLGQQLAEGLTAAHEQGVIHRDLKPGNLRLTPDGRLKILDFGLAKLLQPVSDVAVTASVTEAHTVTGTLPYMAPEQLRGEATDARADIWAAGAVLYELATGRRPFDAKLSTALAGDIQHKPPPPPRQLKPELSPKVEDIILKCLEKDRDDRYQSAKELGVDLRRLAAPASTSVAAVVPSTRKTRKAVMAVSLALLLALVAAMAVLNPGGLRDRVLGRRTMQQIQSIAVLPLENLSRDPEQDYFADGMTEALITDLSKIGALKVISRTSVMRYKKTDKSLPEIGRELNVDAVVEGSVVRQGDRVRITVQLVDALSDKHIWAENYNGDLRDVLALQGEVARAIANEIRVKLTADEQGRAASPRRIDPEAYEAYLRGRYLLSKWPAQAGQIPRYFQEAIDKQPDFAEAYSGLARSTLLRGYFNPPHQFFPKAKTAAERALQLNPNLGEAYVTLAGYKSLFEWDWAGAEQHFRRAIELDPNSSDAHMDYAAQLVAIGRSDEAIAEMRRAQQLDPVGLTTNRMLGFIYMQARRYENSIVQNQKTLELDPNHYAARWQLALCYTLLARYAEALAEFKKLGDTTSDPDVGFLYAVSGQQAEARKVVRQMERLSMEQLSKREYVSPFEMAVPYAGLRDHDKAIEWLERGYRERDARMFLLKVDPRLDNLRSDPRFQNLLRRMNFPP